MDQTIPSKSGRGGATRRSWWSGGGLAGRDMRGGRLTRRSGTCWPHAPQHCSGSQSAWKARAQCAVRSAGRASRRPPQRRQRPRTASPRRAARSACASALCASRPVMRAAIVHSCFWLAAHCRIVKATFGEWHVFVICTHGEFIIFPVSVHKA